MSHATAKLRPTAQTVGISKDVQTHAAEYLVLERLASEPFAKFVYGDSAWACEVQQYLFERRACEFAPMHGRLLVEHGTVLGMMACLAGRDVLMSRMMAGLALAKSGLLDRDPGVRGRMKLAGSTLIQPQPGDYYLSRLAVSPQSRRHGAGSQLLEQFITEGRQLGCTRLTLEVSPEHEAAVRLYRRHGFELLGQRRVESPDTGRSLEYLQMFRPIA